MPVTVARSVVEVLAAAHETGAVALSLYLHPGCTGWRAGRPEAAGAQAVIDLLDDLGEEIDPAWWVVESAVVSNEAVIVEFSVERTDRPPIPVTDVLVVDQGRIRSVQVYLDPLAL